MHKCLVSFTLLCAASLTACSNSSVVGNEDSQFFSVSPGSTFTLSREITIQPDQTSVYLQNGSIKLYRNIDIFRTHCKFELYSISEQARTVKPDTFSVVRVVDRRDDVSTAWPLYAGLDLAVDGGPMHKTFSTKMYLESKLQPDVFSMDCMKWDWINIGEFVNISQMRQALGDYFTLTLAE
jgi:hypothetical protein